MALGSSVIPVRQSSPAILCALPTLLQQPTPGSGHPSLPWGPLPGLLLIIPVPPKMFTYSLCLGMVFCNGRCPSGSPWLLWLGRGIPWVSPGSPGGSILPPLDYLALVQESSSTGRPLGIGQKFPPRWSCSPLTLQGVSHPHTLFCQGLSTASPSGLLIIFLPPILHLGEHPLEEVGAV